MRQLSEAINYLHEHKILHNDIKNDNVVVYKDKVGLKPVLLDFGKACPVVEAEYRARQQRAEYREKHSHIAPEIVCGIHPQSTANDFSQSQ